MKVKTLDEIIQFKHTEPSPVRDTNFEIIHTIKVPIEVLYAHFLLKFLELDPQSTVEPTSIMNIPVSIREHDINLQNAPWYEFKLQGFNIRLSPRSLIINCPSPYTGWDKFYEIISSVIGCIKAYSNAIIISGITRIGLRYTSIYENINIVEKTTIKASINDESILLENTDIMNLIHSFRVEEFSANVQIINKATATIGLNSVQGSLLDIDTYLDSIHDSCDVLYIAKKLHDLQKRILGTILTDDFISECNNDGAK